MSETSIVDFALQSGLMRFMPDKYEPVPQRAHQLLLNHYKLHQQGIDKREKLVRAYIETRLLNIHVERQYPHTVSELREILDAEHYFRLSLGPKTGAYLDNVLRQFGL